MQNARKNLNPCGEIFIYGGRSQGKTQLRNINMGGAVKMAMREPNGKVHAGELYTSSISAFFDNDRFLHMDTFHIREFFYDYPGVNDDRTVAPGGYGLVFGDHIGKKIYTMQGYTSLLQISEVSISLSVGGSIRTDSSEAENYLDHRRFMRLYEAGYIKERVERRYTEERGVFEIVTPIDNSVPVEQVLAEIVERNAKSTSHAYFSVDIGFEVVRYKETPAGIEQFKKDLLEAGIPLSKDDLKVWEDDLNEKKEYYEEDEEEWDPDPYE